jgi:Fur family transcriptional regulator, ferric uptake regulator
MDNEKKKKYVENPFNQQIRDILTRYLDRNNHRKTPERYAILDEIYLHDGHFNIESLFDFMNKKNYRVSRATLYNTMDLLLDCNLVIKHQFGKNTAQYERAYDCAPHHHLICIQCGKVVEFCDARIDDIEQRAAETYHFIMHYHALYCYGVCKQCQDKV